MYSKSIIVILALIFLTLPLCLAQKDTVTKCRQLPHTHSIGLQINPYINSTYFRHQKFPTVFAVRYGYQLKNNLRFGGEFSLWSADIPYYKSNIYRGGLYTRYSFLRKLNFQPFVEVDGLYYYENSKYSANNISGQRIGGGVDYFLSPGFTFYFLKKHLSLDVMFKWNHRYRDLAMGPFEPSYRLAYHFDQIKFK